ncbi:MAG: TenA family transcriptional regulator [Thermoproteota archaeon]
MAAPSGKEIISALRSELEELNRERTNHPFVVEAEKGSLPLKAVKKFVANQLYIVPHDMKSLAFLLSRARDGAEAALFKALLDGDYKAMQLLKRLAEAVGLTSTEARELLDARAVAYTHYLSWLALHATLGQAAVALVVNLPVWGSNTARLARALRENYGIAETGFLELFAGPYDELENKAYIVVERYYDMDAYRTVARMIQAYEKMFWDAVYSA